MAGGATNEAWGKITYHILSLPMTTHQRDGINNAEGSNVDVFRTNERVEVLQVVSSVLSVNLPFEYRSPLATNYRYYTATGVNKTGPNQLYGYNNTTYYFYNITDGSTNTTNNADYGDTENKLGGDGINKDDNVPTDAAVAAGLRYTPGAACSDNIHIYVTYDVAPSAALDLGVDLLNPDAGNHKIYNIHLKDRMVVLNQKRQNRPGAVLDGYYTPEQLASNDFEWISSAGIGNGDGYRHFAFKFGGNDPYNVTIFTAFDKNYTYRDVGQLSFFNTYKKDKDKYYQKDVYKEYRGSSFFSLMGSEITSNMWLSSEAHTLWQEGGTADNANGRSVPGFFKGPNDNRSKLYEMSPIFNSFAILNHKSGEGWALAGSKMNSGTNNWQPRAKDGIIQYMSYKDNGNNIIIVYTADASACKVDVYEVKEYVFRVVTPFGTNVDAIMKWSDYAKTTTLAADVVPDALKRKYVEFTGKFYTDAAHTTAVTTFAAAQANCSTDASGRPIIYVDYETVGVPFTAITADNKTTGYATATWYEMTDAASSGGNKIKWDGTNSVYKNDGGAAEYNKESEFAFIGDPYELRVINRALTVSNTANRYVGSTSRTTATNLTNDASDAGAGFKWEIPYDETLGSFTLRELGSGNTTSAYWNWDASSSGNNIQYSTSGSTRIKVMEIGKLNYTFKVVDLEGKIAIEATAEMSPFTTLSGYANIPAAIRSPFLADETVTFYDSYTDRNSDGVTNRRDWHAPSEQATLTELPGTACDIYVAYTTSRLSSKNIQLIYSQSFNVKLNGEYIYWDSSEDKILSNASPSDEDLQSDAYMWHLRGRDPYAFRIDSRGKSMNTLAVNNVLPTMSATIYATSGDGTYSSETVNQGMFVKVDGGTWDDDKALTFDSDRSNASRFIAMMGNNVGVYEVLAASGDDEYYHIGRASTTGAETRIYGISTYAHGDDQLRFELASTTLVTYHLIDKSGNELFEGEITSKNPRMTIPADYVSPLVSEYYYYPTRAKALTNLSADRISEITDDTDEEDNTATPDNHIYVRYNVGDFGFGSSHPYLLRFLDPFAGGYYLEDGSDKLTTRKIEAVYPYCNGDGNLNIYGTSMNEEQMEGGSSTRPRWVWYFESENADPYHVKIFSKSTISLNGSHPTYFRTAAVHFKQDTETPNLQHIVTGGHFPNISGVAATEYMILGITGKYKLVSTSKIAADLNGDGDTDDDGENERRTVTSFEQYWKTYNMLKLHVLGISKSTNEYSTVSTTFVIPDELRPTLKTRLDALGIGGDNWHSYNAVANATRWNGYNDVPTGHEKKKVEELEHWFQTFDMGDGTFDIENADIPAVLVLLDRHGWEIMRKPLPTSSTDPDRDVKLAALRAFDSPMVKEYQFYNNASKASGCHRYTLRMQNGAERDPIKLNGQQYTSTSLADLPPTSASGVMSSGALNDHFVTYTVKEEYESSYDVSTGTASKFLVLQGGEYAQPDGDVVDGKTVPAEGLSAMIIDPHGTAGDDADSNRDDVVDDVNLWYVQPNTAIDDEMGYPGDPITYTDAENGFDPYNVQLKNVSNGKFFTTHMTRSILSGGVYSGVYSGDGGSLNVTLADSCGSPVASPESYDHTTLQMTNQTFMAVQDENGNMQLMPRFDYTTRINAFTTLAAPLTEPEDDHSGAQTTELVRPVVFTYKVIDNKGNVALSYKTGGEFYPDIPEHFKSPLAKDFKYYKDLTATDGIYDLSDIESNEITSSFAAAGIQESADIFIRYSYDKDYDIDHDNILQGRWMTIKLGGKDVQASGTVTASNNAAESGTGVSLFTGSKPTEEDDPKLSESKQWQWKFLQSPCVTTSPYYIAPDPYAVLLSNRSANYSADPTVNPNPMGTAIKVSGYDRFVILNHPDGDYALAAAGDGLTYRFLNGADMTTPSTTAASVTTDASFSSSATYDIADGERLQFINDIPITYTYKVITDGGIVAASQEQEYSVAMTYEFVPVLPEGIRTPLLNQSDYLYYGSASVDDGVYTVDTNGEITTLHGLFDDVVYVRYNHYDELKSPYKVPNVKGVSDGHVVRGATSNDASLGLNNNLLYNIIWYNDEMMKSSDDGTAVQSESDQSLQAVKKFEWQLAGNDPYAIKIRSVGASSGENDKYIHEATSATTDLSTTATTFMILSRDGYDYGVLAKTGTPVVDGSASMLSGNGDELTTGDPTKFIIFALATHKVIYHLMIKPTGDPVIIPYKGEKTNNILNTEYKVQEGSTQRDLVSGGGTTYQLGTNIYSILTSGERVIGDSLYCVDAGCISLGDVLSVPEELYRPNVVYKYFIEGVYNAQGTASVDEMNNLYKGLECTTIGDNVGLLGTTVLVNIIYTFNGDLVETNHGEGFVMDVADNQWYTFETSGDMPFLAHYTSSAMGLHVMPGRDTRYTNDYLWTPLGDPYGFRMYNRYVYKNDNHTGYVMTTPDLTSGTKLVMAEPGKTDLPEEEGTYPTGNDVYELLESSEDGYFNVHPVADTGGTLFLKRGGNDLLELNTTPTPLTFGLSEGLFTPYYERAGYPGGLTTTEGTGGKALYEEASNISDPFTRLMELRKVVYNDDNIVRYAPGYYRLHSQPGTRGLTTVRYASGYLHERELTDSTGSTAIPMHFYSRTGITTTFEDDGGLTAGFTVTPSTRGPITVLPTEYDPSTIFYMSGTGTLDGNARTTLSTQGLYVKGVQYDIDHGDAVMTDDEDDATTFSLMDIGAGVFQIHDGASSSTRKYLNYSQAYSINGTNMIYDLRYYQNSPVDESRWCMEPVSVQGLKVTTNSGGDGYYYCTFYAPYDVLLPADADSKTYNAYVCTEWDASVIHPKKVAANDTHAEGKFVPAGTPVIIRTSDNAGSITLSLPSTSPTDALSCVFSGKYLEQLLPEEITASDMVYAFGLPITGYEITTTSGEHNGEIPSILGREQAETGVGFYLNATPDKELSTISGQWLPNNRYVLHNKAYYRTAAADPGAKSSAQFIPVEFDFEDEDIMEQDEQNPDAVNAVTPTVKSGVYDMQGRKVATEEQVGDGTWRQYLAPGMYIVNGKKIQVK